MDSKMSILVTLYVFYAIWIWKHSYVQETFG